MKVIITGGTGFIGRRLAAKLMAKGNLVGAAGKSTEITKLIVSDITEPQPPLPKDPRLEVIVGDFGEPDMLGKLITPDTGVVFHLAAVVSGGAEQDFDLGMDINLTSSQRLLEACRQLGSCPRLVFASSVAVYGGDMPDVIEDGTALTPQTSYGAQKAIVELLINDYSRKGFIDGRALRLPTIIVRPGKPNKAASSFASSIIREPLQGQTFVCPVSPETGVWVLSPRRVVDCFIHAAELSATDWGYSRAVALPGITVSVKEMVEALRRIAGDRVVERISWKPDPVIEKIVYGWATRFNPLKSKRLGFKHDDSIDEIIKAFIDDELSGSYVA